MRDNGYIECKSYDVLASASKSINEPLRRNVGVRRNELHIRQGRTILYTETNTFHATDHSKECLSVKMDHSSYAMVKRCVIASPVIDSGARPSAILGLRAHEVEDAVTVTSESGNIYRVVSVANHKTSEQGPFHLILREEIYNALKVLCQYTNCNPFQTCHRRRFSTPRISYEFCLAWTLSGCHSKYENFNSILNRKRIISRMAKLGPQMKNKYTTQQLRYSVRAEATSCNLATYLD